MQRKIKVGDIVLQTKSCGSTEVGIEYTVEIDGDLLIRKAKGQALCNCISNWKLVVSANVPMVKLNKLQEANLSEDAQALVEVGALDGGLNINNSDKMLKMLVQINIKKLATLAREEIAEAKVKAEAVEDEE